MKNKWTNNRVFFLVMEWIIVALAVAIFLKSYRGMPTPESLSKGFANGAAIMVFSVVFGEIFRLLAKSKRKIMESQSESFFRGWNLVGLAILFPFIAVFRLHYLNKGMNPEAAMRAGLYWGSIWYSALVISTAWRFFPANAGGIYQGRFVNPITPISEEQITDMVNIPKGVYPIFQGIHFIPWHWKFIRRLNMESEDEVSETITIYDRNNLSGTLKIFANATPIRGIWAVNILRVPREMAKRMLMTAIVGQIQSEFGANYNFLENAVARLPELTKWARERVLEGFNKLSFMEKIVGLFLGEIVLQDLKPGQTATKIIEARSTIKTFKETFETVRAEPGMTDELAVSIACSAAGIDQKFEAAIVKNIGNRNDPFMNTEILREAQHNVDPGKKNK